MMRGVGIDGGSWLSLLEDDFKHKSSPGTFHEGWLLQLLPWCYCQLLRTRLPFGAHVPRDCGVDEGTVEI